jgi:hypothetical protein
MHTSFKGQFYDTWSLSSWDSHKPLGPKTALSFRKQREVRNSRSHIQKILSRTTSVTQGDRVADEEDTGSVTIADDQCANVHAGRSRASLQDSGREEPYCSVCPGAELGVCTEGRTLLGEPRSVAVGRDPAAPSAPLIGATAWLCLSAGAQRRPHPADSRGGSEQRPGSRTARGPGPGTAGISACAWYVPTCWTGIWSGVTRERMEGKKVCVWGGDESRENVSSATFLFSASSVQALREFKADGSLNTSFHMQALVLLEGKGPCGSAGVTRVIWSPDFFWVLTRP